MSQQQFLLLLVALLVAIVPASGFGQIGADAKSSADSLILAAEVQHHTLGQLGKEHIAHAIHRQRAGGVTIVAWGGRIVEWPLNRDGVLREVVAARPDSGYSNGGCALDLNGDGIDELIIARGRGRWALDPQLLWFQEVSGQERWIEHAVARLGTEKDDSPHDMAPIMMKRPNGESIRGVVVLVSRRKLVWYEVPKARLGVFQRAANDPTRRWTDQVIDRGLYCPHSLVVTDLDGDRRPDLIAGEMSAGGWDFPLNPSPRILAYRNQGQLRFDSQTLVKGWGVHELGMIPPRDKQPLILYAADEIQPQKFANMKTHVSFWEISPKRR